MLFKFVLGQRNVLLTQEVLRAKNKAHNVSEALLVDDRIGSCAGIKVMVESTAEYPVGNALPAVEIFTSEPGPSTSCS